MTFTRTLAFVLAAVLVLVSGSAAMGDVFDMSPGLTSLDTVAVGNPGNAGELSGAGAGPGGYGPDRICGAVNYTYSMGKFEVTAAQYTEFLNAVAKTDTYWLYNPAMWDGYYPCKIQRSGSSGGYSYSVAADWANRPVNYVSWGDAARFCNWLTNGQPTGAQGLSTTEDGSYYLDGATTNAELMAMTRKTPEEGGRFYIPTEDEWYKAAYYDPNKPGGAGYWDYPTGTDAMPSNDLITPDPGNNANVYHSGYTIGSPYWRTEVGEFENSESPYGTFDQAANLFEWTEAILETSYRGRRGGSFSSIEACMHAARRDECAPHIQADTLGFRVSEVPEPAMLSLLAIGGLALMRRRRMLGRGAACVLVAALLAAAPAASRGEAPYAVAWIRQLGTSSRDESWSVAVDGAGNAFISGWTEGSLGGPNAGQEDAFLSKYNSAGNLLWTRQLGTSSRDESWSVAADGAGNTFISGYTEGSLGGPNAGGCDAFLSKYDSAGDLLWTQQLGTSESDYSYSVAVDSHGNAFISGETWGSMSGPNAGFYDVFLSKYDSAGNLQWTRQLGTSGDDRSRSVVVDGAGNAFISGATNGSLGGPNAGYMDAFLSKYDSAGNLLRTRQLGGSSNDLSLSVAVDSDGNAFISGRTFGSLGGPNAGNWDAFLAKYDSVGNLQWTKQLGSSDWDCSFSVAVDGAGNAFISGYTDGSLGGPSAGGCDAFLSKYDSAGNLLWTQQLGTLTTDYSYSVAVDGAGNVFISGGTAGSLGGASAGGRDAFLVKFIPEPASAALLLTAFPWLIRRRRWSNRTHSGQPLRRRMPATLSLLALGACLPLCRRRSRQGLVVICRRRLVRRALPLLVIGLALLAGPAATQPAAADVFNMGAGLTSLETVTVGNPGNAADTRYETPGYGAVGYEYNIGKYEVTNAQYREFLNAMAAVGDANGLYNAEMAGTYGGIARGGSGTGGNPWVYTAKGGDSNWDNRPVNFVSWYDALRFSNWLHNGQPTGAQDASTTEDGSYDMSLGASVARKPWATWALPTEDEWYKAAYYDPGKAGGAGYWDYPTASDTAPTAELPAGTDLVNGSANYYGLGHGYIDTTYFATPVGAYTAKPSDSAYGTFDQGGNLFEWNDKDVIGVGSYRGVRGGSSGNDVCTLHASYRSYYYPTSEGSHIGFRVSEVPEPASMAVLALGACPCLLARGGQVPLCRRRSRQGLAIIRRRRRQRTD